jgi:hypothetical protein
MIAAQLAAGRYDAAGAALREVKPLLRTEDLRHTLRYTGLVERYYQKTGMDGYEDDRTPLLDEAAARLQAVSVAALDRGLRVRYYNALIVIGAYREDAPAVTREDTARALASLSLETLTAPEDIQAYVELRERGGTTDDREFDRAVAKLRAAAGSRNEPLSELLWVLDLYASRMRVEIRDEMKKVIRPESMAAMLGAA